MKMMMRKVDASLFDDRRVGSRLSLADTVTNFDGSWMVVSQIAVVAGKKYVD